MTPILTIIGFIALYVVASRLVSIKRKRPFGFQAPKKTLWEKISQLLQK
jgi:hypothetical protein